MLHIEARSDRSTPQSSNPAESVSTNTAACIPNSLLMMCHIMVHAPDGSTIEARGLLDSGSLALSVLEWLYQSLSLVCSHQSTKIHGIVGLSHSSPFQAVATFDISPTQNTMRKPNMTAIVVPNVT